MSTVIGFDIEEQKIFRVVENSWEVAPQLVNLVCTSTKLNKLDAGFQPAQFQVVVQWLDCTCEIYRLLADIGQTTTRISDIVKALKTYTYLYQAPIQNVDIHAGLESTITILQSKLSGIKGKRRYAEDLPQVEAYGSEQNKLWTNLIENAIEAVNGKGEIRLVTRSDNSCVIVEIEDNGKGIPEDIQACFFDPFFTAKPPGQGTGLGLYVSYNIVVQKHNGRIEAHSQPGNTRFEVRLPLHLEQYG